MTVEKHQSTLGMLLRFAGILAIIAGLILGISQERYDFSQAVLFSSILGGIMSSLALFALAKIVDAADKYLELHR